MPTYHTKAPAVIHQFLTDYCELMSGAEWFMHVQLNKGTSSPNAEKLLQAKFGLNSTETRNVWDNLKGKRSAVIELQKVQIKDLKETIDSIEKDIKERDRKIKSANKFYARKRWQNAKSSCLLPAACYLDTRRTHLQALRFGRHQKKRRLAKLKAKLAKLEKRIKSGYVSLAFGTKDLFNAQHHLESDGYGDHAEWLEDWRNKRHTNFILTGNKIHTNGNQLCKLTQEGQLSITVPEPLREKYGCVVSVDGIEFKYGAEAVKTALTPTIRWTGKKLRKPRTGTESPVTHRFVNKDGLWYLHTYVPLPEIPWITHWKNGCIGVDLNVESIDWAHCDAEGNLKAHGSIKIDLDNKSSEQREDILSKAIEEIIILASTLECPICIEKLDFSKKKARLRELRGKKYAAMLSSFAYSKFGQLIESKANSRGVQLYQASPSYSSLIGLTKYMAMYGLNSGTAAALVLARRFFRFSERLPISLTALASPVDDRRHVWSAYRRVAKELKGCFRHSYFATRIRVGVKPLVVSSPKKAERVGGKSKDTPAIPSSSYVVLAANQPGVLPKFA